MKEQQITVGKKYPGPIPENDAPILEMTPAGQLVLLIQLRRPSPAEAAALQHGFTDYSIYHDANGLALWVFKYPPPLNYMDTCFHAGLYEDNRAERFIQTPFNILQVHVLDGEIVTNFTLSFIRHAALRLFQQIVSRQVTTGKITRNQYDTNMADVYRLTPEQIFHMGHAFTHGQLNQA